MMKDFARFCASWMVTVCLLHTTGPVAAQEVDYNRADQMLGWNLETRVTGVIGSPNWLRDGHRFWYRVSVPEGHEFIRVDPARNSQGPVFDHTRLAAALSTANDTSFLATKLPFSSFEFGDDGEDEGVIEFQMNRRRWECDIVQYLCTAGDSVPRGNAFVQSPDERWEAFIHEHNLYVRPTEGSDSIPLTNDGAEFHAYGVTSPRPTAVIRGSGGRPQVRWAPDSRRLLVTRTDERDVEHMHVVSMTHQRPKHYSYPYALPGDSIIPRPGLHLIDLDTRSNIAITLPGDAAALRLGSATDSVWTEAGDRVHAVTFDRGSKAAELLAVDAATGEARSLIRETNSTFVNLSHRGPANWSVLANGDFIWFSERDGWGHLYRFGPDGELKNQITQGDWLVDRIHHIDERSGRIWFTAWGREEGRNPYHAHFYRVDLDGSGLTLLTPEDAHHDIDFAPEGRYFVDRYSSLDRPPVTLLRAADDGRIIRQLEEADAAEIVALGWTPPEPFVVKGRDGVTDIYGVMYKPSDFDPTRKYPIINNIYPGPQIGSVRTWGFEVARRQDPHAMAELGFIVVQFDHMGSPFRSKAFHDAYYGQMGDHGLPDHVTGMKQLAARHSFIDLDRVGIYGHSGGGFASTGAMFQYPDFFHVAVARAGNHDNRSYQMQWGEKYQGLLERDGENGSDNYENQVNFLLAENLKGKLLLIHGDMDDNVHPAMTMQVVNALIDANKDFDLLIMPDRDHTLREPYVKRREWDYFVTHLMGVEPPADYEIVRPQG